MRAFIGIRLPEEIRAAVAALQQAWVASQADVKWVAPACLHVTLKFLGEIREDERRAIEALLRGIAQREAPFPMQLNGIGAFPSPTAPRVVWVGVAQGSEVAVRIAEAIEREGAVIPLAKEERAFHPHVTLGRVRSPRHRQALVQRMQETVWQPPAAWTVESVTLYQSVLSPRGPQYTVLADVPLKK